MSEKIRLRAFESEDLETILHWVNDEDVTMNLSDALVFPVSRADELKWLESVSMSNPREKVFAVETMDGRLIGSAGLRDINWIERKAELGIMIGEKSCWNQGFGTAAIRELLRTGFGKMNLNRIYLRVFENNMRAIHVYRKCGFQQEGILREDHYRGSQYYNTMIMGILRREFFGMPNAEWSPSR